MTNRVDFLMDCYERKTDPIYDEDGNYLTLSGGVFKLSPAEKKFFVPIEYEMSGPSWYRDMLALKIKQARTKEASTEKTVEPPKKKSFWDFLKW